jgi:Spy/CpxP family protein refolding chaperone
MKKSILLSAIAILFFVGLSSCSKDGSTTPTTTVDAVASMNLPDYDNSASTLIEGTEAQEIACEPPPPPDGRGGTGPGMGKGDMRNPRERFDPLGQVLRTLKLTPDQVTSVKTLMQAHMECVKAAMLALRETEKPIIEDARAKQKAIIDQVKAGTMTRAEAMPLLRALNEATRKALNENPARQAACIAMERCKKILFDAIMETLTPEQKRIFQAWIDKGPKDPCTQRTTTP